MINHTEQKRAEPLARTAPPDKPSSSINRDNRRQEQPPPGEAATAPVTVLGINPSDNNLSCPHIEPGEFDPAKLALSQNFLATAAVRKEIVSIPIRRPGGQTWFCAHPDERFRISVGVIEVKDDREHYI